MDFNFSQAVVVQTLVSHPGIPCCKELRLTFLQRNMNIYTKIYHLKDFHILTCSVERTKPISLQSTTVANQLCDTS